MIHDANYFTRLTAEVLMPDGEKITTMVESDRWDLNATEVADMFKRLMLGMGYHQTNVDEVLSGEPEPHSCVCPECSANSDAFWADNERDPEKS